MTNDYTLKNIKKIKWGVLEEVEPLSLWPVMVPGWEHIVKKTGRFWGKPQTNMMVIFTKLRGTLFVDHDEWTKLGEFALKKIIKNPSIAFKLNKDILKLADQLINFAEKKIFKSDLRQSSAHALINLYREYEERHGNLYAKAIIPVYLDLYKPHLSKYLIDYLDSRITKLGYTRNAKECFALLTVIDHQSRVQLEEIGLLRLAQEIIKRPKLKRLFIQENSIIEKMINSVDPQFARRFTHHCETYRYLGYNFEGPAFQNNYFVDRLQEWVQKPRYIAQELRKIKGDKNTDKKLRRHIQKDLKMDKQHTDLFEVTRQIIFGKDYRKMALVNAYYHLEKLLKEITKRSYATLRDVRNCSPDELLTMINNDANRPQDLEHRNKGSLFIILHGKLPGKIFVDDLYKDMLVYLNKEEDFTQISYFHGQSAAIGKGRGVVKIINSVKDMHKMQKGDILVSQMTNPDLLPAMKKAAAIITDHGGVTCHAAIVSRELKIPCVIGTKIATRALKDGDVVFVDADQGEVRKI